MPSAREVVDAAQSEAKFQAQIVELAERLGWRTYHTYDSRRSARGFPDLVLVRGPTALFLEVKKEKAKPPSPEQEAWIAALKQVRYVFADFVYPRHWDGLKDTLQKARR